MAETLIELGHVMTRCIQKFFRVFAALERRHVNS
jgi:hypothetical protein